MKYEKESIFFLRPALRMMAPTKLGIDCDHFPRVSSNVKCNVSKLDYQLSLFKSKCIFRADHKSSEFCCELSMVYQIEGEEQGVGEGSNQVKDSD